MKTIVLITHENSERTTHVSVFLCGNDSEAKHFCHFVNRVSLAGENKLFARRIKVNAEYSLEKYQPFAFDDFVKLDDRTMQLVNSEVDSQILAVALKDAKEEIKEKFFRNTSKRSASMLQEDIEHWGPVSESDIENARQLTLDVYDDLLTRKNRFDEAWSEYKNRKESKTENQEDSDDREHIVLVFCGAETAADRVSVYLYDKYESADGFCNYINALKPDKGSFFYARHADQMVEYETTKPLLVSFAQIFKYSQIHGEFDGALIIREALNKFESYTILQALKGMDKHSRTLIMQSLPTKFTDEINEYIEHSDKYTIDLISLSDSRKAQQKIINAVNITYCKYKHKRGIFKVDYVLKA
jgi:hypothetical protein